MALDELLAALEREADRTARQLIAGAMAEAGRIAAESEQVVAAHRDAAVGSAAQAQRAAVERAVADAGHLARRDTLAARELLLQRIVSAVRSALPDAVTRERYVASLPARVAAAAACFADREPLVLRAPRVLIDVLRPIADTYPAVTLQESDQGGSGFHLSTVDGAVDVDATLESRLDARRVAIARQALQLLELTS